MITKKQVLSVIRQMPDEFPIDAAIDQLMLLHKIQKGSQEIKDGKGLTTVQVRKKLKK
jgi:hypothetical protein